MNPLERGPRAEPNLSRGTELVAIDGTGPAFRFARLDKSTDAAFGHAWIGV